MIYLQTNEKVMPSSLCLGKRGDGDVVLAGRYGEGDVMAEMTRWRYGGKAFSSRYDGGTPRR